MTQAVKIYKPFRDRAKNTWKCRVVAGGKAYYVSEKTKGACQLRAADKAEELRRSTVGSGMYVEALCRLWINERCANLSPTSLIEWSRLLDKWVVPYLGKIKLNELRNADCQKMITEYNRQHSAKSCSALRGVLHNMLEFAVVNELIEKNPSDHLYISKTVPYQYYIYTAEEMQELYKRAEGTKHLLPIMLASRCGLRLSEICGLRWEDINLRERTLRVLQVVVNGGEKGSTPTVKLVPKTVTSSRPIIIPQSVTDYLTALKLKHKHKLVFCYDDGAPYLPRNYGRQFAEFLKAEGLPHTRFHDLRHFVATSLMDAGVPDKEIAEYMRHADTAITRRYEHIRQNRRDNAAAVIDGLFA